MSSKKMIDSDLLIFRLRKYIAASEELRELHKGDKERIWKCKVFEQAYRNVISEIQGMKGEIL